MDDAPPHRPTPASIPLDPSPADRRALLEAFHALVDRYLDGLDLDAPSFVEAGADTGRLAVPEEPLPLDEIVRRIERDVLRPGGHPGAPGHLAYISGSGLWASALADYVSSATNKFAGLEATGPGPSRMERAVVRWAADLVGFPAGAGGHIASGGSLATFASIVAARDAHRVHHGVRSADVPSLVVYLSTQAHHCIHKALHLAGLGEATLRTIETADGRLDPDVVSAAIEDDRAAGRRPWLVVATAGTTDTGTVDPIDALADVADAAGCWFHVDAAYGGGFLLTEHGRRLFRGIERADSVILDPHKGLFVPWGMGIVLTRDARTLAAAHAGSGAYLQDTNRQDTGQPDDVPVFSPADLSPELTKPFRALRLWLPIALSGLAPFRAELEEKLDLARDAHRRLAALGFEVGPPPDLSTVTFRWIPDDSDDPAAIETANRRILQHLLDDGRIFLSSTRVAGRYTLRLCVLGFRSGRETIDLLLDLLASALDTL